VLSQLHYGLAIVSSFLLIDRAGGRDDTIGCSGTDIGEEGRVRVTEAKEGVCAWGVGGGAQGWCWTGRGGAWCMVSGKASWWHTSLSRGRQRCGRWSLRTCGAELLTEGEWEGQL
jgi:hypothetical protein